jgi:hypothetical protein
MGLAFIGATDVVTITKLKINSLYHANFETHLHLAMKYKEDLGKHECYLSQSAYPSSCLLTQNMLSFPTNF